MMDRRAFVSGITLGLLAAPLAAEAQPVGKIPRLGLLRSGADVESDVFKQSLHELGYREGHNILVESFLLPPFLPREPILSWAPEDAR